MESWICVIQQKYGTIDAATVLMVVEAGCCSDEITIKTSYSLKSVLHDLQTFSNLTALNMCAFGVMALIMTR